MLVEWFSLSKLTLDMICTREEVQASQRKRMLVPEGGSVLLKRMFVERLSFSIPTLAIIEEREVGNDTQKLRVVIGQ